MILLSFMNCKVSKCQSKISNTIWFGSRRSDWMDLDSISHPLLLFHLFLQNPFVFILFFCSNSLKYAQIERNEGTLASLNIYPKHISSYKIWICMCGKTCDYADDFKRCYSGLSNMLSTVCTLYSQSTVTATVHRRR